MDNFIPTYKATTMHDRTYDARCKNCQEFFNTINKEIIAHADDGKYFVTLKIPDNMLCGISVINDVKESLLNAGYEVEISRNGYMDISWINALD